MGMRGKKMQNTNGKMQMAKWQNRIKGPDYHRKEVRVIQ
jgi:hypothetical protein